MKTTTFFSSALSLVLVASSLIACNPRDPDVLSADDRAHNSANSKSRKNDGGDTNSGDPMRAKLPQKMDLSLGLFAEGRILQVQKLLNLALNLASSNEKVLTVDCVRATLKDSSNGIRAYLISYANQCQSSTDVADTSLTGLADLTLNLNEKGELSGAKYSSHPLSDTDANVTTMQVFSKGTKDNLSVREALRFELVRNGENFDLNDFASDSVMVTGFKDTLTQIVLSVAVTASLNLNAISNSHVEISGQGLNLNATNANPVRFSMLVDGSMNSEPSAYSFRMGKTVRSGKILYSDSDVTVVSAGGRSGKEEKNTSPRQKSDSIKGALTWDSWL